MYYAQLKAAFSSTLAQFNAAFVSDAIAISDAYSRSSVNLAGSSVIGAGDSAVIQIKPRLQESEVNGSNRWLEPSARVTGVNGYRPTFRFLDYGQGEGKYNGYPWQTTRRPMFSYDRETWHYFDTQSIASTYIEFRHNTTFAADTVYISRSRQTTVDQVGAWLESIQTSYPTIVGPTDAASVFTPTLTGWSGQDFIADEYSSQTNELGGTIPPTPFYAAQINDTGLMPGSGVKSLAVVIAGVHAGEDHAHLAMREFVECLLGNSAEAQNLRRYYKILIYPMLNAPGNEGGGYRGSFTQGTGGADDANRHFHETTSALEIVDKPKAAMVSDMADDTPVWMLDWHGMFWGNWGVYVDTGKPLLDGLRTRLTTNSGFTVGDVGDTVAGFTTRYFQDIIGAEISATVEHGDATPVSDADLATWGQAAVESIDSMRVDGLIGPSDDITVTLTPATTYATTTGATPSLGSIGISITPATAHGKSVDPIVAAGNISVSPSASTAYGKSIGGTPLLGSLSLSPAAATAHAKTNITAAQLGDVTTTPSPATAYGTTLAGLIEQGSITVDLSAAIAYASTVNPSILQNGVAVDLGAATAYGYAQIGGVQLGSTAITPVPATAYAVSSATPALGSLSLQPSPAMAYGKTLGADVAASGIAVQPLPSIGYGALIDPALQFGAVTVASLPATAYGSLYATVVQTGIGLGTIIDPAIVSLSTRRSLTGITPQRGVRGV